MFVVGWLSPEGKLYECEYMDHIAEAERLVKKYKYKDDNPIKDDVLMNHHWIHLTTTTFGIHTWMILWRDPWRNRLTQEQKNFLKPYIEDYKDWINPSCIIDLKDEFENLFD